MPHLNQRPEWETEFDKRFLDIFGDLELYNCAPDELKGFIRTLLLTEHARWVNVLKQIDSIKVLTPDVEPPVNILSQNQIFAAGQMNAKMRIHDIIAPFLSQEPNV